MQTSRIYRSIETEANFPGFDYPLTFCPMRQKHKQAVIKAIWKSHLDLKNFLSWARYARSWDGKTISKFVDNHINAELPTQHFVFLIGDEVVGVGSLLEAYGKFDCQIGLWVNSDYQGMGIGKQIVRTIEAVAFEIWGYSRFFYQHDALNESSKKLPQRTGFKFSHTFETKKTAEGESGFWMAWVKHRPPGLPPGILQGRPIEDFSG